MIVQRNIHSILKKDVVIFFSESTLCYSHSFAQMCLMINTGFFKVSDVAHGPLVFLCYIFLYFCRNEDLRERERERERERVFYFLPSSPTVVLTLISQKTHPLITLQHMEAEYDASYCTDFFFSTESPLTNNWLDDI